MIHKTQLEAKVALRNRLHSEINKRLPKILEVLSQFKGKKVSKANGVVREDVVKAFAPLFADCCTPELHIWISADNYGICAHFRGCEHYKLTYGTCNTNAEVPVTLSLNFNHGMLVDTLSVIPKFRTDFNASEVMELREKLTKAKNEVYDLESELREFGQYDN